MLGFLSGADTHTNRHTHTKTHRYTHRHTHKQPQMSRPFKHRDTQKHTHTPTHIGLAVCDPLPPVPVLIDWLSRVSLSAHCGAAHLIEKAAPRLEQLIILHIFFSSSTSFSPSNCFSDSSSSTANITLPPRGTPSRAEDQPSPPFPADLHCCPR